MKPLRQISAVTILSLMLSVGVLAGQIESNGATTTPPPQTTSTVTAIVLTVLSMVYP